MMGGGGGGFGTSKGLDNRGGSGIVPKINQVRSAKELLVATKVANTIRLSDFRVHTYDAFIDFLYNSIPLDWKDTYGKDGTTDGRIEPSEDDSLEQTLTQVHIIDTRAENPQWNSTIQTIMSPYAGDGIIVHEITKKELLHEVFTDALKKFFEEKGFSVRVIRNNEPKDAYHLPDQIYVSTKPIKLFKVGEDRKSFAGMIRKMLSI